MKIIYSVIICSVVLIQFNEELNAQASQSGLAGTGHTAGGISTNYYLGWDANTTIGLEIRHDATNQPIDFWTNGSRWMRLTSNGNFGIGLGALSPSFRLEVQDDIVLRPSATFGGGYRWWDGSTGVTILHTNAASSNLFLGGGSGGANTAGGANTFLGVNAGSAHNIKA